jgi:hypothetical protein
MLLLCVKRAIVAQMKNEPSLSGPLVRNNEWRGGEGPTWHDMSSLICLFDVRAAHTRNIQIGLPSHFVTRFGMIHEMYIHKLRRASPFLLNFYDCRRGNLKHGGPV